MKNKLIVTGIVALILTGCSAVKITHSWQAPAVYSKNYNKIIVVAVLKENDHNLREKMENHLVGDLTTLGYNAVSSLKELGPKLFEGVTEEEALGKLKGSGADAVITIVLLDKEKERRYIPATVINSPYYNYHRKFWGYYSTMSNRIYEPGYYSEQTNYFWESNLYNLQNKELVYSLQTKSFNPNSVEIMGHKYGKLIVKDMVKHQMLTKKAH